MVRSEGCSFRYLRKKIKIYQIEKDSLASAAVDPPHKVLKKKDKDKSSNRVYTFHPNSGVRRLSLGRRLQYKVP